MNVKNGNSITMRLWTIKGKRCLAYFCFAWRQQRIVKSFKARKLPQNNLTYQRGIVPTMKIGGAHKLSAAAAQGSISWTNVLPCHGDFFSFLFIIKTFRLPVAPVDFLEINTFSH